MLHKIRAVEIDVDYCSLTFGEGTCTADLNRIGASKCWNTYRDCPVKEVFARQAKVFRAIENISHIPGDLEGYACLKSVTEFSNKVNIAGVDDDLGPMGRSATVTVRLNDFVGSGFERDFDKYHDERVVGTASNPNQPRDLSNNGFSLSKLKARWPYYAGRALRIVEYTYDNETLVHKRQRHYIITDWDGPGKDMVHRIKAKDALDLVADKKATIPAESPGVLNTPVDISVNATFDLTPAGVGDLHYSASGIAIIDKEALQFTRVGDTVTLTVRGTDGTSPAQHKEGVTFQEGVEFSGVRIDDAIKKVLSYSPADPTWIPTAKWKDEIDLWAPGLLLYRKIYRPEGVTSALKSMTTVGFSLWWNAMNQEFGLRVNRPELVENVPTIYDDDIIEITSNDRDKKRLTRLLYLIDQIDETVKTTEKSNYSTWYGTIDEDAESDNQYQTSSQKILMCPWLNHGDTLNAGIAAKRILDIYRESPYQFEVTVPTDVLDVELTTIINIETDIRPDAFGNSVLLAVQVVERAENFRDDTITYVVQASSFAVTARYISITEDNATPDYNNASPTEKATGFYLADENDLIFPDGGKSYEII